jgi:hypothetical protein
MHDGSDLRQCLRDNGIDPSTGQPAVVKSVKGEVRPGPRPGRMTGPLGTGAGKRVPGVESPPPGIRDSSPSRLWHNPRSVGGSSGGASGGGGSGGGGGARAHSKHGVSAGRGVTVVGSAAVLAPDGGPGSKSRSKPTSMSGPGGSSPSRPPAPTPEVE